MSIIVTADSSFDLPNQFLDPIPFEVFPLTIIQDIYLPPLNTKTRETLQSQRLQGFSF